MRSGVFCLFYTTSELDVGKGVGVVRFFESDLKSVSKGEIAMVFV